ncbi:VOC family protein [Amycolatopsis sp.]
MAWHVDDIDAALKRLADMGAVEHEPKTALEGGDHPATQD